MEESTLANPFIMYVVSLVLYTKLLHPTLQNAMALLSDTIELFKKELYHSNTRLSYPIILGLSH